MNPQLEYDNQLPPEPELELDLDDALDNLYSERHDPYIPFMIAKAVALVKEDSDADFEQLNNAKRDRDGFSSQSHQFKELNKKARNKRRDLIELLDNLYKLLSDNDKKLLLEYYKELI